MTAITTEGYVGIAGRNEYFNLANPTIAYHANSGDGQDAIIGFEQADIIFGGLGRDMIFGFGGNDAIYGDQSWNDETVHANISLTASADMIRGMNGDDTIFAGGGNNYVNGGAGADYIVGGSGDELLQGGSENDSVYGAGGNDILVGGSLNFVAQGAFADSNVGDFTTNFNGVTDAAVNNFWDVSSQAPGEEAFTGTGNDYLDGGAGNDQLIGGDGIDTMVGGLGNDLFFVDNQSDVVYEVAGQGYDTTVSTAFSFTLASDVELLRLEQGSGAVYGTGNAQTNTILGNSGDNLLEGGAGADDLSGLGGSDIFALRAGDAHGDVIYEFQGNGAASGDVLLFVGYGTQAQGATLTQLDSTHWQVRSWEGSIVETITLLPGTGLDTNFDVQFV